MSKDARHHQTEYTQTEPISAVQELRNKIKGFATEDDYSREALLRRNTAALELARDEALIHHEYRHVVVAAAELNKLFNLYQPANADREFDSLASMSDDEIEAALTTTLEAEIERRKASEQIQ